MNHNPIQKNPGTISKIHPNVSREIFDMFTPEQSSLRDFSHNLFVQFFAAAPSAACCHDRAAAAPRQPVASCTGSSRRRVHRWLARSQYHGPSAPPRGSSVSRVAPAGDLMVSFPLSFRSVTLCHACVTLVSRPIFYSDTSCYASLLKVSSFS